jgi:hypothetical protein
MKKIQCHPQRYGSRDTTGNVLLDEVSVRGPRRNKMNSSCILFLMIMTLLPSLTYGSQEVRLTTPHESLITYVGQQKFKIPNQAGLTGTYIISSPGTYVLSDPITSTATTGQVISITSSNVSLDFSGFAIALGVGSGPLINCITIAPNLSNILIKNGVISTMNGNGISVGSGCLNVRCEDLEINGCTISGVNFAGTSTGSLSGCSMENCQIRQCNGGTNATYGVKLSYCDFFTAKNCSFNSNNASGPSLNCYGFYAISSRGGTIIQSDARGNTATLLATGFYLDTGCSNFLFQNCTAKLNSSSATTNVGKAYGFYETNNLNNRFENCVSAANSAYAHAAGFYTQNCSYNYWLACTAQNNFITGTTGTTGAFGFAADTATTKGNIYDQCTSFGNTGSADTNSFGCGFSLNNSSCCTIKNCYSQANNGGSGTGIGIYLQTGAVCCCVQNCTIIANTSSTSAKAYGIWDASNPSTTLMAGNFAFANRDSTASPTNQNYIATYSLITAVQSNPKNSLKTLTLPTFANTDITP